MAKKYDGQTFTAKVGNTEIEFYCYTTDTRNGFCHTAVCYTHDITNTKVSYYNRTWERFTYESVLGSAIDKLPKGLREGAREQMIEARAREGRERVERQFNAFKALHEGLTPENKERLANSGIVMESEGDVQGVMGLMAVMNLMQG